MLMPGVRSRLRANDGARDAGGLRLRLRLLAVLDCDAVSFRQEG
jgi:hypothetical protein